VELEEFMAQRLTIVQSSITTRKFSITFECRKKPHLKVFKFGRFLAKDTTRKLMPLMMSFILFTLSFYSESLQKEQEVV
jgi:hypothetical protein